MRLEYNDEKVVNLKAILLDGKPVTLTTVNSVDTDEGWVKSYIPKLNEANQTWQKSNGNTSVGKKEPVDLELVTRHGKVELVWNDNSKS